MEPQPTFVTERMITVNQAAHLLSVSRKTVYKLSRGTGPLKRYYVGERIRFRLPDVLALVNDER